MRDSLRKLSKETSMLSNLWEKIKDWFTANPNPEPEPVMKPYADAIVAFIEEKGRQWRELKKAMEEGTQRRCWNCRKRHSEPKAGVFTGGDSWGSCDEPMGSDGPVRGKIDGKPVVWDVDTCSLWEPAQMVKVQNTNL